MPRYEHHRDGCGRVDQRTAMARTAPLELADRVAGSVWFTAHPPDAATSVRGATPPRWSGASLGVQRTGKPRRTGPPRERRVPTGSRETTDNGRSLRGTAGQGGARSFQRAKSDQDPTSVEGPSW
jgi:hypothetical protein